MYFLVDAQSRPATPASPLMRPSHLSSNRSVYGGSVRSFRSGAPSEANVGSVRSFYTAVPSMANRSTYAESARSFRTDLSKLSRPPIRNLSHSNVSSQPMYYTPSPPVVGLGSLATGLSTPPSVSNYMSAGSSPDSPTSSIYSHMPLVPLHQRGECTSRIISKFDPLT